MAQQQSDNQETLSEVNVIPLADLSLVLLIILMVLSPMVTQSIISVQNSKATQANTAEELTQPETPVIVSFAPGQLKLNGAPMSSDIEFVSKLDAVMAPRHDKSVILTASPELAHGKVVHLMDVVQHHGASSLVIVKWDPAANAAAGGPQS